jgi:hypothetical protein
MDNDTFLSNHMQNLYPSSINIQEYSDNEDDDEKINIYDIHYTFKKYLLIAETKQPLFKTIDIFPNKTLNIKYQIKPYSRTITIRNS